MVSVSSVFSKFLLREALKAKLGDCLPMTYHNQPRFDGNSGCRYEQKPNRCSKISVYKVVLVQVKLVA